MRRFVLLLALVIMFPAAFVAAAPGEPRPFAPVQAGPVAEAETVLPWAPDRVVVKFTPDALAASGLATADKAAGPIRTTGLAGVDAVLAAYELDASPGPSPVRRTRPPRRRLGIDRWFVHRTGGRARTCERPGGAPGRRSRRGGGRCPTGAPSRPPCPTIPSTPTTGATTTRPSCPAYDWGGTYEPHRPARWAPSGFDANAQAAWDGSQGYGVAGVVIAILDSGVDIDHPDLHLVAGYDYGDNDSNPDDNSAERRPRHRLRRRGRGHRQQRPRRRPASPAAARIMPLKVANSAGTMYFSRHQERPLLRRRQRRRRHQHEPRRGHHAATRPPTPPSSTPTTRAA